VTDDEGQIRQLIARFANSFDLKAWDALRACLAEPLRTDYSDLRGSKPEIVSRERFVELRRRALDSLNTHHLAANPEITVEGARGRCRTSMVIWRRDERSGGSRRPCQRERPISRR
jgi:hypothetical protein